MIQTSIGHILFNVHPENLPFYRELFTFAGWPSLNDPDPLMAAFGKDVFHSLWFYGIANDAQNDYDGAGMNHLALQVQTQGEVDQMVKYLCQQHIPTLFGTPCHRPEFSKDREHTYYQVMFESPDRILFEVVYMGMRE